MAGATLKSRLDKNLQGKHMKALIIASILFFSLRAISAEEGENKKSECSYAVQTNKREAKVVESTEDIKKEVKSDNIRK